MIVTELAFYLAMFIYSIIYDTRFIQIYLCILIIYYIIYLILPSNGKMNSLRKKLQIASWSNLREGAVHFNYELDCSAIKEYLEEANKDISDPLQKITLTHVIVRGLAETYSQVYGINGRIFCGKFLPYPSVNINVLCDVDQGKDLAMIQVQSADKLTIKQIAEYVNSRANKIKQKKDSTHQKQMDNFKFLPPFIITIMFDIVNFVSVGMGIKIPNSGFQSANIHGCVLITNVGMLGHNNTFASHNIACRVSNICTINKLKKVPAVQDDKIVIKEMINLNFTVDHRFMDGGISKQIVQNFEKVFHNPQSYH